MELSDTGEFLDGDDPDVDVSANEDILLELEYLEIGMPAEMARRAVDLSTTKAGPRVRIRRGTGHNRTEKPCTKCFEVLSLDSFYSNRQMRDGRINTCKRCCRKRERMRKPSGHRMTKRRAMLDSLPLGLFPDLLVARNFGISATTITTARESRGIGAWCVPRTCWCGQVFRCQRTRKLCCSALHTKARSVFLGGWKGPMRSSNSLVKAMRVLGVIKDEIKRRKKRTVTREIFE